MKHLRQITEIKWHVTDTDTGKIVHTHNGYGYASVETSKHAATLNNAEYNMSKRHDRYKITTSDDNGNNTSAKKASDWIDNNGDIKKKNTTQQTKAAPSKAKPKSKINKKNAVKSIALAAAYKGLKHLLGKRR